MFIVKPSLKGQNSEEWHVFVLWMLFLIIAPHFTPTEFI